ncbi:MAG: acyl-CoA dehydrogenase family protein, partial [Nitrospinota bacterium]
MRAPDTLDLPFHLTEPQEMLRRTVRALAERHIAPRAAAIDETEEYPEDIFQLLKAHDLLGLYAPPEYGGSGMGILGTCLAIEEIARFCSNSPLFLSVHLLATRPIAVGGSPEQKERYLRGVARGELRASLAMTEPHAGTDVANIRTRAAREGGEFVIHGQKAFCTGSTHADFIVVAAKTDPEAGSRGISLFIVPKGTPGLRVGRKERKMGMRGIPTCEVLLEGCRVPAENMVGEIHQGFRTAMRGFNQARPVIGARGVGLAQGCLDYAARYAQEREAFGQPIGHFQAVQFMLADMFLGVEAARLLGWRAAAMVDAGCDGKEC